ncbi:MAG: hypothetical protein HC934_03830 [Acaryochloridaceae cyanobacterium SU_2_1]|nr:hypothetical protein [Acaryochloridaceae cyanobacterium SU_2_1]NJM95402.1 hypothetical protein [Acaryochloridaceae cyanobacterium CSU_5_19]
MTPTLLGRWQTRLLLMETVGLLITLIFCGGGFGSPGGPIFFWLLQYLVLFGLAWDYLYIFLQSYRWDQDWPAAFQWLAALWEGLFIILVVDLAEFKLPGTAADWDTGWFLFHYSFVWIAIFIVSQSLMRVIFPRWRFRGGQWL